jgi:hypothetical protein
MIHVLHSLDCSRHRTEDKSRTVSKPLPSESKKTAIEQFIMASTTYEYSALPEGCFRLLTIVSVDGEKITCKLENFLFNEAPEYTALSYAWGNPDASKPIICDGKSLLITPHLHGTFHHLHALVPITKIWIDAICINQADLAEGSSGS